MSVAGRTRRGPTVTSYHVQLSDGREFTVIADAVIVDPRRGAVHHRHQHEPDCGAAGLAVGAHRRHQPATRHTGTSGQAGQRSARPCGARHLLPLCTGGQVVAGSDPVSLTDVSPTDVMSRDIVDRCPGTWFTPTACFRVSFRI
jgi:hypothetical protein